MTMGLILLGVVAVLIFFGLTERLFKSLRLANWLGFVVILALAVGVIAPSIRFSDVFLLNVGGFLLPVLFMLALAVLCFRQKLLLRAATAEAAVMALTVVMLFFFPKTYAWQRVVCSLIIGILGGGLAFFIGGRREAVLFAALGGVAMGELTMRLVDYFAVSGAPVLLGSGLAFDAMIVSALVGIASVELVARTRHAVSDRHAARHALGFEAAADADLSPRPAETKKEEFTDYFDDSI